MNQSTLYKSWRKSYNVSLGDIWDVHTISETYHIERVDGNPMRPNDVAGVQFETGSGAPVVPGIGDPYQYPTGGLGTTQMESMLCRNISWSQPDGKGMEATARFETRYFEANAARGLEGEDLDDSVSLSRGLFLPCQVLPVFMSRNIKLFRDNPGMTGPNATNDISTSDIGGIAKEIDQDVKQVGIKLRMVIDTNSIALVGSTSADGILTVINGYLGCKNNASFLGYGVGNLVCTGANLNHLESEFYEIALEYTYDQYFHHSQYALKDTDGKPKQTNSDFADVRWTRPTRTAVDFNDIWPSGDLGKSQKYQAFAGRWY